jgi:uncharacterized protein YgbK (DUF1537 family)
MIADDLTGACDAGVQFAERGIATVVWLDPDGTPPEPTGLLVLTTDSRDEPPETARAKVGEACRRLAAGGRELVFKKIDSTLRGNIAAEIESCGFETAWVAPAFPALGRTVAGGWVYANGVRVAPLPRSERILPFDAVSQEELAAIVRRAFESRPRPLLAGSGGLAREVAAQLAPDAPPLPPFEAPRRGVVAFAVGSRHPATLRQLEYLKANRPSSSYRLFDGSAMPGSALVMSGGDTARTVCRSLGASGIRLHRQVLDGIPYGTLLGGPNGGVPVVTKSGGFGREDALARIVDLFGPGRSV